MGEEWAQIIETACAFDPTARYASAAEFGSAVEFIVKRFFADTALHAGANIASTDQRVDPAVGEGRTHGVRGGGAPTFTRSREAVSALCAHAVGTSAFARIPVWMGRIWNALVLTFLVAMLWMSVEATFNPPPVDAGKSIGYLFAQNIMCIDPMLIIGSYLILDRRRIRERYPALARWGVLRETVYGIVAMAAVLLFSALVVAVMGWS